MNPRAEVESPCNKICRLNEEQVCIGCGRHIDEIALWSGAGAERRLQIRDRAAQRLQALRGGSDNPPAPLP